MLLAQAMGEYVGISAMLSSLSGLWLSLENRISSVDSSTWAIVGVAALVLFFFWSRR